MRRSRALPRAELVPDVHARDGLHLHRPIVSTLPKVRPNQTTPVLPKDDLRLKPRSLLCRNSVKSIEEYVLASIGIGISVLLWVEGFWQGLIDGLVVHFRIRMLASIVREDAVIRHNLRAAPFAIAKGQMTSPRSCR
eukprot:6669932-Prorocentrum_lima.AAC.1